MILEQIVQSLACLDKEETISLTVQAILEGKTAQEIVLHGLLPGLDEVAKRYAKKDTYILTYIKRPASFTRHSQRQNIKFFPWR